MSGVGTQLTVADYDGDQDMDVLIGNKRGTFLFNSKISVVATESYVKVAPKKKSQRPAAELAGTNLFASHIRETEALSPEEELKTFSVPAGFEVQLFASEPDIAKPLNMAFDARGRMWLTNTVEYPYAAPADRMARDSIKILEDTNGDGRADKITTFADNLNIPMGLYPHGDGVICFSIPNIWYLRDTDGDDVCDTREKLYGPIGYERDVHGMCNAFTRGPDGWLYACHGFNNETKVSGSDGHEVSMHSGNIFRMKLDGSRIEVYTRGQVNPFGMTFAANGDIYTADCHTKPISMLVQGGYHESFGKPNDGLGFIPNMMEHSHGSTAICGIVLGESLGFGQRYANDVFSGNVTACRINRNRIVHQGSTPHAVEEPDFLISGDPWFRPADLQVGPDGALYVADFYNSIIGHYEVPLDHPKRDRERGRIWRVVQKEEKQSAPDFTKLGLDELLGYLGSPIRIRSELASRELESRFAKEAIWKLVQLLKAEGLAAVDALWLMYRLGALTAEDVGNAASSPSSETRRAAQKVIAAHSSSESYFEPLIGAGLVDKDPLVRRFAANAAANHNFDSLVSVLMAQLLACPKNDPQLHYTLRLALRNHLRNGEMFGRLVSTDLATREIQEIAGLCLSLKTPTSAGFLLYNLKQLSSVEPGKLSQWLEFSAQYAPPNSLNTFAQVAELQFSGRPTFQKRLLTSIRSGLAQRGEQVPKAIEDWASKVATDLLKMEAGHDTMEWEFEPLPQFAEKQNIWVKSERRKSEDRGNEGTPLWSSFPKGEQRTGIFRSAPFKPGEKFSFFMAGHDGHPPNAIQNKNYIQMLEAATGQVLHKASPPRNDTARKFEWDTGQGCTEGCRDRAGRWRYRVRFCVVCGWKILSRWAESE